MNSTRIIVIQLKELIMTILFSVLGVILLGILIYIFVPKDKIVEESSNTYIPGKYISSIILGDKSVEIEVVVSEKEISSINFLNLDEQQKIFYPLVQPTMANISQKIIDNQSLDVEISSNSEATSSMLLNAIKDAINKAIIN